MSLSHAFHLCPDLDELHCHQRLNYVLGQVLGVKDFQQEQLYFLHKSRMHHRSLHGYGTVWGLDVTTHNTGDDLEVQVAPGLAIDSQGREVWVEALQCAPLNTWLATAVSAGAETANWQTLQPIADDTETVAVYVTLCYRPCKTGAQPILGNPCRTDSGEEGVIQYTRIADNFELQLRSQPPLQLEETWVRSLADLLDRIDIDPSALELDVDAIATLTQTLRDGLDDPPRIPTLGPFILATTQAEDLVRELLRYWVTHTRPTLDQLHHPVLTLLDKIVIDPNLSPLDDTAFEAQVEAFTDALDRYITTHQADAIADLADITVAPETSTALRRRILQYWDQQPDRCQTTEDECLLLAAVQFRLTAEGRVDETVDAANPTQSPITVEHRQRPYLLHTRLLQELLLQNLVHGAADEIALGPGSARYLDPTEPAAVSGVFPAEPLPADSTVAFDVIVPNPALGTGAVRYQTGDEAPGVFPVEPLPDGTNVAFDVIVPAPPFSEPAMGVGEARYATGDETAGVFPVEPLPDGTNVAFDVVVPPPPRPALGEGTVTVAETGGRSPGVYPDPDPETVAFNVVIPRPEGGGGPAVAPTTILRPMDLLSFGNLELPNQQANLVTVGTVTLPNEDQPIPLARPGMINGYPALVFTPQRQAAAFSTLRPAGVRPTSVPQLRLYTTARAGTLQWQVLWRWVRSFSPLEGEVPPPNAEQLVNTGFVEARVPENNVIRVSNFHLYRTPPIPLAKNESRNADYLMAYLVPRWDPQGAGESQLYLLMAELRWEV